MAGILTGDNEQFIHQIPDLTGMKSEVIIQKSHRNPFDHQLRTTGIKLVVIESREELKNAVNENKSYADAQKEIKLPKYEAWPNYNAFLPMNIERYFDFWNRGI